LDSGSVVYLDMFADNLRSSLGAACVLAAACTGTPAVPATPTGPLDLGAARALVLELVNRDRVQHGLAPVDYDETAEQAAQEHADDMAHSGYTAHWGTDGSVPEERYTRAGGEHFVQENAACFFDGAQRPLDPAATFAAAALAQIEAAFLDELPPHDGHRKNILKSSHTGLGIGLSQPVGVPQPCMTQEFVDVRGSYERLPRKARLGSVVHVAGELAEPVEFGAVGLSRIEPRLPLGIRHLNATSSYPIPAPYATYFPSGYQTPKPVAVQGREFAIDLPLSNNKRPGRYGVSVWGIYPERPKELVMVSLRVIEVR
jgi:uncharacterized protein YkwD